VPRVVQLPTSKQHQSPTHSENTLSRTTTRGRCYEDTSDEHYIRMHSKGLANEKRAKNVELERIRRTERSRNKKKLTIRLVHVSQCAFGRRIPTMTAKEFSIPESMKRKWARR